jgi:hypothetical protein
VGTTVGAGVARAVAAVVGAGVIGVLLGRGVVTAVVGRCVEVGAGVPIGSSCETQVMLIFGACTATLLAAVVTVLQGATKHRSSGQATRSHAAQAAAAECTHIDPQKGAHQFFRINEGRRAQSAAA